LRAHFQVFAGSIWSCERYYLVRAFPGIGWIWTSLGHSFTHAREALKVLGRVRRGPRLIPNKRSPQKRDRRVPMVGRPGSFGRFMNLSGALLGAHVVHAGMSEEAGAVNRLNCGIILVSWIC
jgi:hypothetical protein